MDEFKPENELKPDPSDRRAGRYRKSANQDNEPQLNIDDVDFDYEDDYRPSRDRQDRVRDEAPELYEAEDDDAGMYRSRQSQKTAQLKRVSRQHIMMGVGILVLLLLVIGVGSALKSPSERPALADNPGGEKSISLGQTSEMSVNNTSAIPADNSKMGDRNASIVDRGQAPEVSDREISLPPVSPTPTQSQDAANAVPQRRIELQGDLGNALSGQQDAAASGISISSSLPTQPATVAPIAGPRKESAVSGRQMASQEPIPRREPARPASREVTPAHKARPERVASYPVAKTATAATGASESKVGTTKTVEQKASAPKRAEAAQTAAARAPEAATATQKSVSTAKPSVAAASTAGASSAGNVGALQSAPGSHYTLQLSSSSNFNNLNSWAKKENLQNYVVYQTKRNGQPWYVLVTGVYGSKDEAKKAVSSLPAGVQAKNPWTKPIHQVQTDLGQ